MSGNEVTAIVMDNGSGITKAGFAGDDTPRAVFPTVVGSYTPEQRRIQRITSNKTYIGDEALVKKEDMNLKWPIEHGVITNTDAMEQIWRHTFKKLAVDPKQHPVLLTESPQNPKKNRQKMACIMFETFNTPAACVACDAFLSYCSSLSSSKRSTGVILSCGHGVTSVTPIYEGYVLPRAVSRVEFAGKDLTSFMGLMLESRSPYHVVPSPFDQKAKEQYCYVAPDYEAELEVPLEKRVFKLPDGQVVIIRRRDAFTCPEALFQPSLLWRYDAGVHTLLNDTIDKCDVDIRKDLYANIVLTGGSTLFPGFADRLQKEMTALAPETMEAKVFAHPERENLAWIGGSILSSHSTFQQMWVSKQEYDESGPSIVHRKCV